ncbi:glycosyltransferase family 2 protein [Enterobacter kobei]|uniref:glycosyltransferase family 2 protein n=1 Tax=Enterobacter kobei TaxID=208224 RepID=UPI002004BB64|nr:glycosyltransferase family 2 protein [Enterobacter kobei]MCK6812920.1 glycosyltransferase family 2 protein [Enterobacter kobei]MCQ4414880.1 glycosyltransferase family 2 protein [Enterobacter kobei]MDK9886712.1 glycosyltransferase family 2 protein [Enterobacter kobei]HDC4301987.1 glycosyltransferase family 2 protein [Enterobacter kobei]
MFISVVSHGHANLIITQDVLSDLAKGNTVIVTDNIGEKILETYCESHDIEYIINKHRKGFGENNNQNFIKAKEMGLTSNDIFLVLNPDVIIEREMLSKLTTLMMSESSTSATINLHKPDGSIDNNIRHYPSISDFIISYILGKNKTIIDKSKLSDKTEADWASGSFIAIKANVYEEVSGFDERYFMYCEDLDLCRRIYKKTGKRIDYFPQIQAIHYAAHQNRKILSKHFFWHVKSVIRYCLKSEY